MSSSGTRVTPSRAGTIAVLVSAGSTPYLPEALSALAAQTLLPDVVLVVDTASRDNGLGDGTPVEELVEAAGLTSKAPVRIVRCPRARGFRDAVSQGLRAYTKLVETGNRWRSRAQTSEADSPGTLSGPTGAMSPITEEERVQVTAATSPQAGVEAARLWLLHDDCAPAPTCLAELVSAIRTSKSVGLAGPKQIDWERPERLLEVGLATTASARRANDIAEGEIDQGQHDDRSDVLAVGSAGALIERELWESVGGPSPLFPVFGDGLELSRVVRLSGHRVIVVPSARLRHRRASYLGLRPAALPESDVPSPAASGPDPDLSFRARRTAQLSAWAAFSARPLGLLLAYFQVLAVLRGVWRLLAKEPGLAVDEVKAAAEVLRRRPEIDSERQRLAGIGDAARSLIPELYISSRRINALRRDHSRQLRERAARAAAPSELEVRELSAIKTTRRAVLSLVLLLAAVAGAVGLSRVLVTRFLTGGALVNLGMGWHEAWTAAWSSWAASGDGLPTAPNPLLAVLSVPLLLLAPLGVKAETLVSLLLVLALPLSALGAWYAAGAVSRRPAVRAWAALTWAAAPTLFLAVGQGRLPAVLVHLVLPWALMALSRALGDDRRDVILSGMVGAQRLSDSDRTHRPVQPSRPAQAGQDEAVGAPRSRQGAQGTQGPVDDDPSTPVMDDGAGVVVSASTRRGARIRAAATEQYGPGSVSAAAAAGLLLGVVATADALVGSVLVLLLTALVLAALLGGWRARGRLLLTLAPVVVLLAPAWWGALRAARSSGSIFSTQGLTSAVRLLATEIGNPVAVQAPGSLDLLLGLPAAPGGLGLAGTTLAVMRACSLVLLVLALMSVPLLARPGRRARVGLVLALVGLLVSQVKLRVSTGLGLEAAEPAGGLVTVPGWAGTGVSLLQAGLVLAGVVVLDRAHSHLVRHSFGWRHLSVAAFNGAALLAAASLLVTWSGAVHTGAGGPLMMLRSGGRAVPAIAAETQRATGGRVLAIGTDSQGLTASLWRADGHSLLDSLPVVRTVGTARVTQPVGQPARPRPRTGLLTGATPEGGPVSLSSDVAGTELAQLVVQLTSGQDEAVATGLARHGVAVVLLTDTGPEGTEAAAGINSTPGLEQLARTHAGRAWRVSAPAGGEVSGAVLVSPRSEELTFLPWPQGALQAQVPAAPGGEERTLFLAERADRGWRATLDGKALETVPDPQGWRQAFKVPAAGGRLEVRHHSLPYQLMTLTIWAVCGVTALAAVPLRRRRDGS